MTVSNAQETRAPDTTLDLEGDRAIVITRTFRAPPRFVFEAWTKAEHVKRWFAPKSRGAEIVDCTADVRVGGTYRYVTRAHGDEFAFSGAYREVTPHTRLVYTQTFEPMAHLGDAVITLTFEDLGGRTRIVAREVYPSAEVREGVLASGMEHGMRETLDQLDALVASLAKTGEARHA
jgi:uncharacterized protein YndB with AHSA1/START domain